jgi:membrane associated rhomboid family serine protease
MVKILDERKSNIGSALVLAVLAMSFSEVVQRRIGGVTYLRGEFLDGAWWQPFTAQLVHITFVHAVLNVAAMVLIATSFRLLLTVREQFLTFMGGVFGVALAVAMDPHCSYYAGASGALHGMLGGVRCYFSFHPRTRSD